MQPPCRPGLHPPKHVATCTCVPAAHAWQAPALPSQPTRCARAAWRWQCTQRSPLRQRGPQLEATAAAACHGRAQQLAQQLGAPPPLAPWLAPRFPANQHAATCPGLPWTFSMRPSIPDETRATGLQSDWRHARASPSPATNRCGGRRSWGRTASPTTTLASSRSETAVTGGPAACATPVAHGMSK